MNKLTLVCIQMFVLTEVLGGIMISSCSPNFYYCARNSQCCSKLCTPYKKGMPNICSSIPKIDKTTVISKYMFKEESEKQKMKNCLPLYYRCSSRKECCSGSCKPTSMNNPRGRCAS
nr:hyp [Cotesia vestalis bracovirus]